MVSHLKDRLKSIVHENRSENNIPKRDKDNVSTAEIMLKQGQEYERSYLPTHFEWTCFYQCIHLIRREIQNGLTVELFLSNVITDSYSIVKRQKNYVFIVIRFRHDI